MQVNIKALGPPAISDRNSGFPRKFPAPRGRKFVVPEAEAPEKFYQAETVAGSILTPGPMVEEMATRLT